MKKETFAMICYLVLMDHHEDGFINAHPNYIEEKKVMLNAGFEAYSFLGRHNQMKVMNYLTYWKIKTPDEIEKYELEQRKTMMEMYGKN